MMAVCYEIISEPVVDSDSPERRIKKVMNTIDKNLEKYGLNDQIIDKAKMLCPDLIESAHSYRDLIDFRYQEQKEDLSINERWLKFIELYMVPYFWTWCEVIIAVQGPIK